MMLKTVSSTASKIIPSAIGKRYSCVLFADKYCIGFTFCCSGFRSALPTLRLLNGVGHLVEGVDDGAEGVIHPVQTRLHRPHGALVC